MNNCNARNHDEEQNVCRSNQFASIEFWINVQRDGFQYPQTECDDENQDIKKFLFFNRVNQNKYTEECRPRSAENEIVESVSHVYALKASLPANFAFLPRSSSIRSSSLYFATRSVRQSEPVLI